MRSRFQSTSVCPMQASLVLQIPRVCVQVRLGSLRRKTWRVRQVAALDPLPDGIIEQYRVLLRLPYSGQFDRTGTCKQK